MDLTPYAHTAAQYLLMLERNSEDIDRFVQLFFAVYQIRVYVRSRPQPQFTEDGTSAETVYKVRGDLERQYRSKLPRVPEAFVTRKLFTSTPWPMFRTLMTSTKLYLTIRSYGGAKAISRPAKLLAAANIFPFITKDGFSLAANGLQPFMVWEHGQVWRLLTSLFLHNTENHLLANLAALVLPTMILAEGLSDAALAAHMLSLGLLANGLYVLLSKAGLTFFALPDYHFGNQMGMSGLSMALQVVATYRLSGGPYAPLGDLHVPGIGSFLVPTQYSCWLQLLTTQARSSNISLAQQLSGIAAGLVSVFIPKLAAVCRSSKAGQDSQNVQLQQAQSKSGTGYEIEDGCSVTWSDLWTHAACGAGVVGAWYLLHMYSRHVHKHSRSGDSEHNA